MIIELVTTAIKCDGAGCDARLADVVPQTEWEARMSALRLGWAEVNEDGEAEHYCPACVAVKNGINFEEANYL